MRKRRGATPENVDAWIRRGDGQGEGVNFRPFFHVRDVPSRGRSHMVVGLRTGRTHHYLSDIEYSYHLLTEYSPEVLDIREQFALLPGKIHKKSQPISESGTPFTQAPRRQ